MGHAKPKMVSRAKNGKPDAALLEQASNASKNASSIFVIILLAAVYCCFAIAMTNDPALLSNSANLSLPIVEQSVPILWFYYTAPILLVVVFVYFQICMQGFWSSIAKLQRSSFAGRIDDYLPPSTISAIFLRPWIGGPQVGLRRLPALGAWLFMALAICIVPVVLLLFWGRFLVRHDWFGTTVHIILFVVASLLVLYSLNQARHAATSIPSAKVKASAGTKRSARFLTGVGIGLSAAAFFLSYGAINGAPSELCNKDPKQGCGLAYAGVSLLETMRYPPVANFNGRDVSTRPNDWSPTADHSETYLDSVAGAGLAGTDLRHLRGKRAFLVDADLTATDLRWADLERADLRGAHLEFAKLSDAKLTEAKLQWAYMTDSELERADLNQASLNNAALTGANFANAKLQYAKMADAHGLEIDFRNANLQDADMVRSELRNSNFDRAILTIAKMSEGNFSGSRFVAATLISANLEKAQLAEASFESLIESRSVSLEQKTILRAANLTGANLYQTKFTAADLTGATLVRIQGEGADFRLADLSKAKLRGARLQKSGFQGANLEKADLTDCFLVEADFAAANLTAAKLVNADLRKANLTGASLAGADLSKVDFTGANVAGVNLAGAKLDGVKLAGARGLTQAQLDSTCGITASLPSGLQLRQCT